MKRTTTLLATALCTLVPAWAQVIIGLNEMPQAGDELRLTQAFLNPFINYAQTGPGYSWNYANLQAETEDTTVYHSVASTNIVYALVYADLFFNPNAANHATAGVDIPFNGMLPIADPYTFLHRSSAQYKKVGFGAEVAGIPLPIIFDQQDVIYELPLDYGDASVSNSAWAISLPSLAHYGYQQTRTNEVDGWGAITTPAGSFDVLRVRTTLAGRDTINIDSLGFGFAIDRPVVHEYKWLAPNLRVPVMQVNTTEIFGFEVVTAIYFYDEPRSITVEPPLASAFCPGQAVNLTYAETGVFNPGSFLVDANEFIVQLSDANGDFTAAVEIGQVTATTSGIIPVVIPPATPFGTGYRIRLVSTSPAFIGSDNGFDITITDLDPVAVVTAAGSTAFCAGGSVTLDGSSGGGLTYQWQRDGIDIAGATNATYDASFSGNYTVVVSNDCGTDDSDPVQVIVEDAPLPSAISTSGVTTFCAGGSVVLDADVVAGVTYQWYQDGIAMPGANAEALEVFDSGTYAVTLTSSLGCISSSIDTVTVIVEVAPLPSAILPSGSTTFCEGDSVILTADLVPGVSYQWFLDSAAIPGATSVEQEVFVSGMYAVTLTSALGCSSASSDSVLVVVETAPLPSAIQTSGSTTFCVGGSVVLTADPVLGASYQWYLDGTAIPGATSEQLEVFDSGNYAVTLTNGQGCTSASADTVAVVVNTPPAVPVIALSADTLLASGTGSFQWAFNGIPIPGATDAWFIPITNGDYTVTVTDVNGCTSTSQVYIYLNAGVQDAFRDRLHACPNPTDGQLRVEGGDGQVYRVLDASGRCVAQGRLNERTSVIDLGGMNPGLYLIHLEMGGMLRVIRH